MIYLHNMELITGKNDKGRRLDRILRKALPDHPLPLIHRLLRQKKVFADGKPAKAKDLIDNGVKISIPSLKDTVKPIITAHSLLIPDIIWQNTELLAVNKPPGLEVHGNNSLDSMVNAYLADKIPPSLSFKPGPLHRLDKPTSGIVVFSKSLEGARLFSLSLREQRVQKTYLAVVKGTVKKEEIWQDNLSRDRDTKKTFVSDSKTDSKTAITKITPLAVKDGYSLIKAEIVTGRTHQIRAQAAFHRFPLAGDVKYGGIVKGNTGFNELSGLTQINHSKRVSFFLHAWKMEFMGHLIEAPLPEAFKKFKTDFFGFTDTNK